MEHQYIFYPSSYVLDTTTMTHPNQTNSIQISKSHPHHHPQEQQEKKDLRLPWRPWEDTENHTPNIKAAAATHRCPEQTCKEHAGFKRKPELKRHLYTQHMNNHEECKRCKKIFTRKDNLTRHMKSAHDDKSKPECVYCRKPLSRKDAVSRHQATCKERT